MTIFGTSLTSSSYSCVQEREGTLRGATWNRYDTEGDWREGQIVTAGRQLTLHVHMHMHTLTINWQKIAAMGLFSPSYILTMLPDLTYVHVLLVLRVIYDCISKHLASSHPQIYQLPLTLLQNSWPWIMSSPFRLSTVLNGSSHSPTSLNGAPSTPNGFSNGPAMSSTASLSNQQLPPACGARQLCKLKRFLTTLQQFGNDISPEIGERVRSLVLGLVVSCEQNQKKTSMKRGQE